MRSRSSPGVRAALAVLVLAAAGFAAWLAWIAYHVLCEEGCAGRPWTLVAQLVLALAGLPVAVVAAHAVIRREDRRARAAVAAGALLYLAWGILLALS